MQGPAARVANSTDMNRSGSRTRPPSRGRLLAAAGALIVSLAVLGYRSYFEAKPRELLRLDDAIPIPPPPPYDRDDLPAVRSRLANLAALRAGLRTDHLGDESTFGLAAIQAGDLLAAASSLREEIRRNPNVQ